MAMISNNVRDVSFSPILNSTDETSVRNLVAESSRNIKNSSTEEDGEIGVFTADKYFNSISGNNESTISACKYQKEQEVVFTEPKLVTPSSVASESSSSLNSQTWLLPHRINTTVVKNHPRRKPNKSQQGNKFGGFLSSLAYKCYCSDKTSVDVVEDDDNITEVSFKRSSNNCMDFPKSGFNQVEVKEEVLARKSLEVFGSPVRDKRNRSLSLERRLTMLSSSTSSCTPRIEKIIDVYDDNNDDDYSDDNYSDLSSDLFEIESLRGKVKPVFLTRQVSAAESTTSGCVTPTTCYAPSEASIEWSVVTASAADFASVASDYEDLRPPPTTKTKIRPIIPIKGTRFSNTLLGCKNQKAVPVAEDAYMMRSNNYNIVEPRILMTRFQAETKLTGGRESHMLN